MDAVRIPVHKGGEVVAYAMVSPEDAHLAEMRWWLDKGYAVRSESAGRGSSRAVKMHRVVLGLETGDSREADHVNRDRLDNRRENLRIVTRAQNRQNQGSRGGSSRFRGVCLYRRTGKWKATVKIDGQSNHLGYFFLEEDADAACRAFRAEHMPFSEEAMAV